MRGVVSKTISFGSGCFRAWYGAEWLLASPGSPSQLCEPCRGALTPPRGAPGLSWAGWRAGGHSVVQRRHAPVLHKPPLRGHQRGLTSHLTGCNGWASRGPSPTHEAKAPPSPAHGLPGWRAGGQKGTWDLGLVCGVSAAPGSRLEPNPGAASDCAGSGLGPGPRSRSGWASRGKVR